MLLLLLGGSCMTDNEIKKGDICIYHYADGNGSVNLVEVVEVINSDISKIKCVQVICDKSGNGFFEYLFKTGHTMNASNKYLTKVYCINSAIKEFIERLKKELFYKCGDINYSEICDIRKLIDNLLKEKGVELNE